MGQEKMTKNELYERFAGEEMGDKELIAKPATTLLINEEGSFSAQTLDKHLMGRLFHLWRCWCSNADRADALPAPLLALQTPFRLGTKPSGTAPIPSPWESLLALPFNGGRGGGRSKGPWVKVWSRTWAHFSHTVRSGGRQLPATARTVDLISPDKRQGEFAEAQHHS